MTTALLEKKNNFGSVKESEITYAKLNIEDEEEVIEFEKALFNAFMDRNPNNWLVSNYKLIGNCRFRSNIPYEDIGVYVVKKHGKIVMGISINYNMNRMLQLEDIGFEVYTDKYVCEGLSFFSDREKLKNINFLVVASALFDLLKQDFHRKNIKRVFITCSKKMLSMYELFDFFTIQKKITQNGDEKYLLCCVVL